MVKPSQILEIWITHWRIWQRAASCKVASYYPIAVYHDKQGKTQHMTSLHIAKVLKTKAQSVYNIKDKKGLGKFTSQSLQVGARVVLQMQEHQLYNCELPFLIILIPTVELS